MNAAAAKGSAWIVAASIGAICQMKLHFKIDSSLRQIQFNCFYKYLSSEILDIVFFGGRLQREVEENGSDVE